MKKHVLSLCLALLMIFTSAFPALAVEQSKLYDDVKTSAEYVYKTVAAPQFGSIGGEWAVLGLARSGYAVPQKYWDDYYSSVEEYVRSCDGVLHNKKYTEYSRLILALTAIGADPTDVAGYNLLLPLADFDKTVWQGINGPVWALIALDSGNYDIPNNPDAETQATRQLYIDKILSLQLADGGWHLNSKSTEADADVTGMALQALAKYQAQDKVKAATERALLCLSDMQEADSGYGSYGASNSESVVQVMAALCELGVSLDDSRFVKNGKNIMDALMSYRLPDGSFCHTKDSSDKNMMASEQGLYGLVAAWRAAEGRPSLYRMNDVDISISGREEAADGLPGKNDAVNKLAVAKPGVTFDDIKTHEARDAVEALAARGIIDGVSDARFAPDETITRAQFATIVVRALGLEHTAGGKKFADVRAGAWYYEYVLTASAYGIIEGHSDAVFAPEDTISRQEAAVMVARAAKLCGMDTELGNTELHNMLAQFGDYRSVADWAENAVAFCYKENILEQADINIEPGRAILRWEIAQMLYEMLGAARLL